MIDNYDDLTLGRHLEIDGILHTEAEEIDKQVAIIAILCDTTEDAILALPLADYAARAGKAAFLAQPCPPADVTDKPLQLAGMTLIPQADFTKIVTAQYVDFQTLVRDFPATLPQILAIFLVPEGHAYNEGYDIAEVQEAVRQMPLALALGYASFFFRCLVDSIVDSLASLTAHARSKAQAQKMMGEMQALLQEIGGGSPA